MLALFLAMAAPSAGAAVAGRIGVQLTIVSRCEINSQPAGVKPQINCGSGAGTQPKVTESVLMTSAVRKETARLITLEW